MSNRHAPAQQKVATPALAGARAPTWAPGQAPPAGSFAALGHAARAGHRLANIPAWRPSPGAPVREATAWMAAAHSTDDLRDGYESRTGAGGPPVQRRMPEPPGARGAVVQRKLSDQSAYALMKEKAGPGRKAWDKQMSVATYGALVKQYEGDVDKKDWTSAYTTLGKIRKGFEKLERRESYWKTADLKKEYYDPIRAALDEELERVSRALAGDEKDGDDEKEEKTAVLGHDEQAILDAILDSEPDLRTSYERVTGARKGMVRMSSLDYILESLDPEHRQGLGKLAKTWYQMMTAPEASDVKDEEEEKKESFFVWLSRKPVKTRTAYFGDAEREQARVYVRGGKLVRQTAPGSYEALSTGNDLLAVVMTTDQRFYAEPKKVRTDPKAATFEAGDMKSIKGKQNAQVQMVQHSSFLAGLPAEAAGSMLVDNGKIVKITPHSGHYKPSAHHVDKIVSALRAKGATVKDDAIERDVKK
jgi:hypothetical protein